MPSDDRQGDVHGEGRAWLAGPFSRRTFVRGAGALSLAGLLEALGGGGTSALAAAASGRPLEETQAVAVGTGGAVATVHPVATRAGIEVLRSGGNAVDAAVATAAIIGQTRPYFETLGGVAYMTIYLRAENRAVVIGSRGPAPAAFGPDDRTGMSGTGALAVGVPTTLMAWDEALRHHGTFSLGRALLPAIEVARAGFVVDAGFSKNVARRSFKAFTSTRELFLDENLDPPPVGSIFRNPDLARTFELIAKQGVGAFYGGSIGQAIVEAIQHPPLAPDASEYVDEAAMRPGKMELSDLANYRQEAISPTHVDYRGYGIYSSPPPSSGGSTVGEALNILEGFDLSGPDRALALHRYLEACKLAYADRVRYVGDPQFVDVPLDGLLSKDYAAERRCLIGDQALQAPVAPGDPSPPYATTCSTSGSGVTEPPHVGSTQSFAVADRWGNLVTYTGTLVGIGGSSLVVPGYGFLLNQEMVNFGEQPLFEGDPNVAAGGKRPRGNMAPSVVVRDGRPILAIGAAGGPTIQTAVLGILLNHLDFGMSLPDAIVAARASNQNTAITPAEPAFIDQFGDELTARFGQEFRRSAFERAQGISVLPDGRLVAVADQRFPRSDARVVNPSK